MTIVHRVTGYDKTTEIIAQELHPLRQDPW